MNGVKFILLAGVILLFTSCYKKLIPEKPVLESSVFRPDLLPESEINIPIQISLKPLIQFAEKKVDTVFTSPRWPQEWVVSGCTIRYKYYLRRSPLQIAAYGQTFTLGFTGFYKIIGSTRVCIGNTIVSPWTPPCRCGFEEGERQVTMSFNNSVSLLPDYKLRISINRMEPVPLDKCTVCFFDADITSQVMEGIKQELDLAKKSMADSLGLIDFKDPMQQIWNRLTPAIPLYGLGWLQLNPQKIRLTNFFLKKDSLLLQLGMTAKPVIRQQKTEDILTLLPLPDNTNPAPGFTVNLDAMFHYDSLSCLLTERLRGHTFELHKGGIKKSIVIQQCQIYGVGNEKLILKMNFNGSNTGIIYLTGKPVYNEPANTLEIREIEFDVKTKNFLLKNAGWIFNRKIINEIASRTRFDLHNYIDSTRNLLNKELNRDWGKSVKSYGAMNELKIAGLYPGQENLLLRIHARGNLSLKISDLDFSF